jgi:hypothetical protein
MSSRQEEKAARKAEREAQEAQAAKAAARGKRVQLALGAVLVLAIIAGSVFALTSGGGDSGTTGKVKTGANAKVAIPAVKETDLKKAAAAAQCVLVDPKNEGSTHVSGKVTYKSNPPTSGNHNQVPAQDGIYAPGNEPAKENFVHSLEHGRIEIQYAPGTAAKTIAQLETVGSEELNGSAGYHILVFQNNTAMPFAVSTVAWDHYLGCKTMNPQVFDAIRAFRKQYTDKAPELIP